LFNLLSCSQIRILRWRMANGKKKLTKRQLSKLISANVSHRVVPHRNTTTRHHTTAAGRTTVEVPRQVPRPAKVKLDVVEPLSPPREEASEDLDIDNYTDPQNGPHDPAKLAEDRTQVCTSFRCTGTISLTSASRLVKSWTDSSLTFLQSKTPYSNSTQTPTKKTFAGVAKGSVSYAVSTVRGAPQGVLHALSSRTGAISSTGLTFGTQEHASSSRSTTLLFSLTATSFVSNLDTPKRKTTVLLPEIVFRSPSLIKMGSIHRESDFASAVRPARKSSS
jgi:hypothetical protein